MSKVTLGILMGLLLTGCSDKERFVEVCKQLATRACVSEGNRAILQGQILYLRCTMNASKAEDFNSCKEENEQYLSRNFSTGCEYALDNTYNICVKALGYKN